ncbi:class I SAM-dependent methyltransferase [Pseudooceanicola sp.]|uniref:class I SAM-dependent methyltransferase n=1 Tax=Pseudooceanicola sp. TaxID=1914328 RepID=UPI003511B378
MSLRDHLLRRIAVEGPLPLSEYMAECLLNPSHGYYTTRDPLGAAGDFVTAPEISQMFGEMLGLCLAQSWLDQGAPAPFALAELGPGRGTLMADILRATARVPGFRDAAQVHLLEASPALRKRQAETLSGAAPVWIDRVEDLPEMPLLLVANEFFDALPIRQFRRDGGAWRETVVAAEGEALRFGLGPLAPLAALAPRLEDTADGDIVELCPAAPAIARTIGARIEAHGGAALIVDYGDWRSQGDTFQAMRAHGSADPLETPGAADLTAHVDFEPIAAATPSAHSLLTPQGVFLERLGITGRAERLAAGLDGERLASHIAAHRRLTHPAEMGSLFKVLAFHPHTAGPPPGLEAAGHRE